MKKQKYEHTPSKEIELLIKNKPNAKAQNQTASLVNSTKHLKEELIPILLKIFQNIEEE